MIEVLTPEQPDFLAARLMLLALRAEFTDTAPFGKYRIVAGADTSEGTADSAAEYLASVAKPVLCRGEVKDGVLVASCVPVRSDAALLRDYEAMQQRPFAAGVAWASLRASPSPSASTIRVLCVGFDESLCLASDVVELWHRDYHFAGQVNYVVHPGGARHLTPKIEGIVGCDDATAIVLFVPSHGRGKSDDRPFGVVGFGF